MTFQEKLTAARERNDSLLCVGLDPDWAKLPAHLHGGGEDPQVAFARGIVEATRDLVCAYKPNTAFYEARGLAGWQALAETIALIPDDIPIILDAKRGDIGNTSKLYAESAFDLLGVDAVTVHPYMGRDTVAPFLSYADKAVFVLVKTSNPSAAEFEDLIQPDGRKLYEHVAGQVAVWNREFPGTAGIVAGATYPEDLAALRRQLPEAPFLIPGIGAQGGDVQATVRAGGENAVINTSRAVLFAASGEDFADKARGAADALRREINLYR
jgi:orotidine-5'-phosphate decarboxylase